MREESRWSQRDEDRQINQAGDKKEGLWWWRGGAEGRVDTSTQKITEDPSEAALRPMKAVAKSDPVASKKVFSGPQSTSCSADNS